MLEKLARPDLDRLLHRGLNRLSAESRRVAVLLEFKIELLLHGAGIHSFTELADTSVERLKEVLTNAGDRFRIHDPSTWPEQARLAADGDMGKLKAYQEFLSGGKIKE